MSAEEADFVQDIMERQQAVTTEHEMAVQSAVREWVALRESEVDTLKALTGWPVDRTYVSDPMAEKISEAFADMLFGEDPEFIAAESARELSAAGLPIGRQGRVARPPAEAPTGGKLRDQQADTEAREGEDRQPLPLDPADTGSADTDQERLNDLIEANDLASELRHAEKLCSSEGEVWWRIYVDHGQMEYPIIEWHSRSHVRPWFRGRKLIAAVFVSEIWREEVNQQWQVWRYLEVQTAGYVRNLLYRGTPEALGTRAALTDRLETEGLRDEWTHELGMLAGRIPNKIGKDYRYGRSDYHGIKELLLALNEATTIGAENARLTAKKRIAVPREALDVDGTFDAGEDVMVIDAPLDDQLGAKTGGGRFAVLEYSFDARALIEHKTDLADVILTRVGIAQQFVGTRGASGAGMAESGTALRLRLIPTTLAANGKARFWDDALPKILTLAQLVDAMAEERGGMGRQWTLAGAPPVVERQEPLPQDANEEATRHATMVTSEIESRKTAISELRPDWSEQQVVDELDQIKRELQEFGPPPVGPAPGGAGGGAFGPSAPEAPARR